MDATLLRADCANCAALCCVALAFDRSELFAIDKACGEACPNLDGSGGCRIYEDRAGYGFRGCEYFDCLGAGQRVTQDLFGGRSWQQEPGLLAPMLRAFEIMRRVHEWLALLHQAARFDLAADERRALAALEAELDPPQGWTAPALAALRVEDAGARVQAFLASLKAYVA